MFKLFDILFQEEKEKDFLGTLRDETAVFHQKTEMFDNVEERSDKEINDAIYKSRFALIAIFSQLYRANIILRWIRLFLCLIFVVLVYKLF